MSGYHSTSNIPKILCENVSVGELINAGQSLAATRGKAFVVLLTVSAF